MRLGSWDCTSDTQRIEMRDPTVNRQIEASQDDRPHIKMEPKIWIELS
jgi:hypothetical protein